MQLQNVIIEETANQIKNLEHMVKSMQNQINDGQERNFRTSEVIVRGIPCKETENEADLRDILANIAKVLNFEVVSQPIVKIYCISPK